MRKEKEAETVSRSSEALQRMIEDYIVAITRRREAAEEAIAKRMAKGQPVTPQMHYSGIKDLRDLDRAVRLWCMLQDSEGEQGREDAFAQRKKEEEWVTNDPEGAELVKQMWRRRQNYFAGKNKDRS